MRKMILCCVIPLFLPSVVLSESAQEMNRRIQNAASRNAARNSALAEEEEAARRAEAEAEQLRRFEAAVAKAMKRLDEAEVLGEPDPSLPPPKDKKAKAKPKSRMQLMNEKAAEKEVAIIWNEAKKRRAAESAKAAGEKAAAERAAEVERVRQKKLAAKGK